MNEEILYLMNFLASIETSESYIVRFNCDNYIFRTFNLTLEFIRDGFKDNEVHVQRRCFEKLVVKVGSSYKPSKTIEIASDWIGEALATAQNELAKMEWIPLEQKKPVPSTNDTSK